MSNIIIPEEVKQKMNALAHDWVFDTNGEKWSNNNDEAGDNIGSYKQGFKTGYSLSTTRIEELEQAFKSENELRRVATDNCEGQRKTIQELKQENTRLKQQLFTYQSAQAD